MTLLLALPTLKHVLWVGVSAILLWPLKKLWEWWRHCFWLGFKATFQASMKAGRPLTAEEKAVVLKQIDDQIQAEIKAKLKPVSDLVEPPK
jgi:hypothetical protein